MNIKALLLSAFVLPGLGQIVKGELVKGLVIIAIVTILLLATLFVILPVVGKLLLVRETGADISILSQAIASATPAGRVLLALLAAIWGYAVIDAGVSRKK
ncbi:MAG: hypothetical protein Fur0034_01520 [Desulfuromonadia bacterium]